MPFSSGKLRRAVWKRPGLAALLLLSAPSLHPAGDPAGASAATSARRKILFDDYYQNRRTESLFTEGVPLNAADRSLSNFYSPIANAIPNGTFVFAGLIGDKFDTGISDQPISPGLLRTADAYLLICPIKPESGRRAALSERDADALEAFVANGGMLGLILNSLPPDPNKSGFDVAGMNRVARRFGLEFLSQETGTVLIPVAKDHPLFDGVRGVIYGNGTTIRLLPSADPKLIVLLRDPREGAHDPVGVITPFGKGKVLAFGDSGTLGNAHAFRNDTDQATALREMVLGLLPDGPAPAYGWKKGTRLRIRLQQEQIFSCYPKGNRLFNLPAAEGTRMIVSGVRALDLSSAPDKNAASDLGGYASAVLQRKASFLMEIGANDGRAFAATWRSESGESSDFRILPKGDIVDAALPQGAGLREWQWVLENEVICSPLKAYAQPGEVWHGGGRAPLPHAQLAPVPTLAEAPSTFRFDGETPYQGKPCFLFTRTVFLTAEKWNVRDVVSPEFASECGPGQIELTAGGLYAVTHFWVSRDTLLPVHTEMRISSSLWWKDEKFPDSYSGTHDWKNHENWAEINFVGTFGRLLTADFENEPAP